MLEPFMAAAEAVTEDDGPQVEAEDEDDQNKGRPIGQGADLGEVLAPDRGADLCDHPDRRVRPGRRGRSGASLPTALPRARRP